MKLFAMYIVAKQSIYILFPVPYKLFTHTM